MPVSPRITSAPPWPARAAATSWWISASSPARPSIMSRSKDTATDRTLRGPVTMTDAEPVGRGEAGVMAEESTPETALDTTAETAVEETPKKHSRRRLLGVGAGAAAGLVAGVAGGVALVQGGAPTPEIKPSGAH